MEPKWLLKRIYEIEENETCKILGNPNKFETKYDYNSLLEEVDNAITNLKKPGGGYIPPLSNDSRKKKKKELEALRKYVLLQVKK